MIYGTEPSSVSAAALRGSALVQRPVGLSASAASPMVLYPNPVTGGHFYIGTGGAGKLQVRVYDLKGRVVLVREMSGTSGSVVEIRFDHQPAAGVYMVKVNDEAPVKLIVL